MSYRIAGIDVHKKMLAVVVSDVEIESEYQFERRMFGSSPEQLRSLAAWLLEQEAEEVVMESTAQYWKPVWGALERYWKPLREKREGARRRSGTLHLAQAQSNRGPRGRKKDFPDAERLVKRLVARELTLSFVPDAVVNRNLLLVRYSFERLAKSFKRGELQRRWGGKVTIGKTRSKTEVRGRRVRGMARVVRAGQGAYLLGRCERESKSAHAKPAYAPPKISPTSLSATRRSRMAEPFFRQSRRLSNHLVPGVPATRARPCSHRELAGRDKTNSAGDAVVLCSFRQEIRPKVRRSRPA